MAGLKLLIPKPFELQFLLPAHAPWSRTGAGWVPDYSRLYRPAGQRL